MNENTKILVLAALVLVVAIVSFNLNITGMASKETSITVSPAKVVFAKSGTGVQSTSKMVSVVFKNIDDMGLDKGVDLMNADNDVKLVEDIMTICNRNTCTDDAVRQLRISAEFIGGSYYLKAENEIGFNKPKILVKSNTFTVE